MKKILSLLLMLMMLIPCAALAEAPAIELTTYTHPGQLYTIGYPSDWMALDKDIIETVAANGTIEGIDEATLQAYAQQVTSMDMAIFSSGATENFNIVAQELGMDMDANMLVSAVAPGLVSQFESVFENCTISDSGSVVTFNERDYLTLSFSYELSGMSLNCRQYMLVVNGTLLNFTFTVAADYADTDVLCETVMNSVTLAA